MTRLVRMITLVTTGAAILQFGGCVAGLLEETFFLVGPLLL